MRDDIRDDTDPLDVTSHEPEKNFTSNFASGAKFRSGEAIFAQFRLAKSGKVKFEVKFCAKFYLPRGEISFF